MKCEPAIEATVCVSKDFRCSVMAIRGQPFYLRNVYPRCLHDDDECGWTLRDEKGSTVFILLFIFFFYYFIIIIIINNIFLIQQ